MANGTFRVTTIMRFLTAPRLRLTIRLGSMLATTARPLGDSRERKASSGSGGRLDCGLRDGPPNGSDAKLRGQGPRAEADAAHGVHACESRDAGRAPPPGFDSTEPARPADRSRAASGSTSS